jgi:hypothetical protein
MSDTKWADVAHYYQFSDIEIQLPCGNRKFKGMTNQISGDSNHKKAFYLDAGGYFTRSTDANVSQYRPILRHSDDITEAEAREIYCVAHGKDFKKKYGTTYFKGGYKSTLFEDQYESMDGGNEWELFVGTKPSVFHWLISHGFDVFGLIESGQAIRKEVGNG